MQLKYSGFSFKLTNKSKATKLEEELTDFLIHSFHFRLKYKKLCQHLLTAAFCMCPIHVDTNGVDLSSNNNK